MVPPPSGLNVQSQVSAELPTTGNSHPTDRTIVFMASKSGDTRETVEAARPVKEKAPQKSYRP